MTKPAVAVLLGGNSAERDVSLQSGKAVAKALSDCGWQVTCLDPKNDDVISVIKQKKLAAAFIALHGVGGEDGVIQGALEYAGIAYTGSGVMASALAMDKARSKQLWQGLGLPTAEFSILNHESDFADVLQRLGGKVMVKPATEGSSIGMSLARSAVELQQAFERALPYCQQVMAERWLSGREFTVGIISDQVLPVIELKTHSEFYDYHAKYQSSDTQYLCPAPLTPEEAWQAQDLSLSAFKSLGCEGWGRVDLMQDNNGQFLLLEVNTSPGMTSHSLVPMAAKSHGLSFEDLVDGLMQQALADVQELDYA